MFGCGTTCTSSVVFVVCVPSLSVVQPLDCRDATGASEAIGELTPMERLLSEALAAVYLVEGRDFTLQIGR